MHHRFDALSVLLAPEQALLMTTFMLSSLMLDSGNA